MKGAVQLDRSFRHDGVGGLAQAQPRHVEVPKINEKRRLMASLEYTSSQRQNGYRDTSRRWRANHLGSSWSRAIQTLPAPATRRVCGAAARLAATDRSGARR